MRGGLTVSLPGVGRKTANVVRSVALDLPGLPVDTHVLRLSKRLGLTTETDPVKVELELNPMVPMAERGDFSLRLILHGRRVCFARKPNCARVRPERLLPLIPGVMQREVAMSSCDPFRRQSALPIVARTAQSGKNLIE